MRGPPTADQSRPGYHAALDVRAGPGARVQYPRPGRSLPAVVALAGRNEVTRAGAACAHAGPPPRGVARRHRSGPAWTDHSARRCYFTLNVFIADEQAVYPATLV
jgi:hypothetical protein